MLCKKSEVLEAYKSFEVWVIAQEHCNAIKILGSDCRGEYLSSAFDQHLAATGTMQWLTVHNTPQFNGIAEQLNHTLLERVCTFTYKSKIPKGLWGKALQHTVWIKNHTATCSLNDCTPYKALHGVAPDLSALWQWGCCVLAHYKLKNKLSMHVCEG